MKYGRMKTFKDEKQLNLTTTKIANIIQIESQVEKLARENDTFVPLGPTHLANRFHKL